MTRRLVLLPALLTTLLACSGAQVRHHDVATLAIVHGHVWTGDPAQPAAEAIAIRNDRIVAVGSDQEIRSWIDSSTRVIDAHGATVAPGFIDSHLHFLDGGSSLSQIDLRHARSKEEFVQQIADYVKTMPGGSWIQGGDWDNQNWGGELPTRQWIDGVSGDHPVWLGRVDGHAALANSLALKAAGVSRDTADVPGGVIVRDAAGDPTGVFKDHAQSLVGKAVPPNSPEVNDRALEAAMTFVASKGVTSVFHMGTWDDLAVFRRAHDAHRLRTRIHAAVPLATWARLRDEVAAHGRGDEWLSIGSLKGFVDGSLGSRTAAMLEPYTDAPGERGVLVNPPEDLYAWTSGGDKSGLQVVVHAIGDRANRIQLDIYERVAKENGPRDRRWRIEHAQHLAPSDIPRFARLGVIASMQPYHAIDDGRWAEREIGPQRIQTSYAWRSLLDSGAKIVFGSDWDVAPPTPIDGIYAAVTRRTLDGKNPDGWIPQQKITLGEALHAYTSDAAWAELEEKDKGTIAAGKLGDVVVLDHDLFAISPETIRDTKVVATILGGRIVYGNPAR